MKIFLSYARDDAAVADEINLDLVGRGHQVFFDRDTLRASQVYTQRIEEAIEVADIFLFLISPSSVAEGRYTLTELHLARRKWPSPANRVFPVLVRETPMASVPTYLRAVNIIIPEGSVPAYVVAEVDRAARAVQATRQRPLMAAGMAAAVLAVAGGAYLYRGGVGAEPSVGGVGRSKPDLRRSTELVMEAVARGEVSAEQAQKRLQTIFSLTKLGERQGAEVNDAVRAAARLSLDGGEAVREAVERIATGGDAAAYQDLDRALGEAKTVDGRDLSYDFATVVLPTYPEQAPTSPVGALDRFLTPAKGRLRLDIVGHPNAAVTLGRTIAFRVRSETGGQLVLIDRDVAGQLSLLYPNPYSEPDEPVTADAPFVFPGPESGFDLVAEAPLGRGTLYALVVPFDSRRAVGEPGAWLDFSASPVSALSDLNRRLRALSRLSGGEQRLEGWAYAALTYEITDREPGEAH